MTSSSSPAHDVPSYTVAHEGGPAVTGVDLAREPAQPPEDPYEVVLDGAAQLRRGSLLQAETIGDTRRLQFRGADHVAVRRWIDMEQACLGLLGFDVRRAVSGALCVSVAPLAPTRAAFELLAELSGE